MHNTFTLAVTLVFFFFFTAPLTAQEAVIWPGDIDDSGRINGVDMLHWSHAYGAAGPERPAASTDWMAQLMGEEWDASFPTGLNFAYADADGDGRVTGRDLALLFHHQHRTRASAPADELYVLPDTTDNYEAILSLEPAGVQLTPEGSELLLDVMVHGRNEQKFCNFHGLTFRATLPKGAFADHRAYEDNAVESSLQTARRPVRWMTVDSARAQLSFTVAVLQDENVPVYGSVGRIALPLAAGLMDASVLQNDSIVIDSLATVDVNFELRRVATKNLVIDNESDCSFTVAPVCGADGVTYLNSCFAEAAGVTAYTPGACWNPGLTAANIDPDASCPDVYDPVCGFNGVTYANACAAEAAGVTNYTPGICNPNDLTCYDPSLIVISNGTSVNQATGIITFDCPTGDGPVCGCDGEQYSSACAAEAAGVRSYTSGGCNDTCIDPGQITDTDDCGTETEFVCGCNGETYINACFAEAAGVQNYTDGPCNGASSWCDEATVITCGDYLPNETTVGAGNQLTSYPGGSSVPQQGPDRVYTFQKTSAGDLQVGLEIMTAGLDMNLFLLRGDCN
ncbi:MAG: Kazal-type serine protease inhibitor domain-containing protein, partial [Bacteroidota bacterium]